MGPGTRKTEPRPARAEPRRRRPRRSRRARRRRTKDASWMRDEQEARRVPPHGHEGASQVFGIEGGEGLVEDDELRVLEQRPREEDAAPLPVTELPAGLADDLHDAGGHPLEERLEPELDAEALGGLDVLGL